MLAGRPSAQVRAGFPEQLHESKRGEAWKLGCIPPTSHGDQESMQIGDLRRIVPNGFDLQIRIGICGRFVLIDALEQRLNLLIACRRLALAKLVAFQRLSQGENVMFPPIAFEALDHLLPLAFEDHHIAQFAEGHGVALPAENGFDHPQAADAMNLADHGVEAHIHQVQRPLHVLNVRGPNRQMIVAQPVKAAQLANLIGRDEAGCEQPVAVEHGMPLAVQYIALAPGHVAGMRAIEYGDLQALALKQIVDRDPINTGRLHGHFGNAMLL